MSRQILSSAPFFHVADVVKSAEWYRDKLGFEIHEYWGDPPSFCMPARDGFLVMLSENDKPGAVRPNSHMRKDVWDAYFWIADADALFEQATAAGAEAVYAPMIQEAYGMKEFAIRDHDGYILAFGEDTAKK